MKKEKVVKHLRNIDEAMEDLLENGYIDLNDYSPKSVKKARKALALATAQLSEDYKDCPVLDNVDTKENDTCEECSNVKQEDAVCTYMRCNFFGNRVCRAKGGLCTRSGCTMYKPADTK